MNGWHVVAGAILLCSCNRAQSLPAQTESCIAAQLGSFKVITAGIRQSAANHCDGYIDRWAMESTRRAYGPAFNLKNRQVFTEYRERKTAIINSLMPLPGDPARL